MKPQIQSEADRREAIEHREVLEDLRVILSTAAGQRFFKYLFKNFSVGEMPPLGLEGELLREQLGLYRAGHSIFELASEANPAVAGSLLAQKEKERYAALYLSENE
jgi:hypothetical protein